MKERAKATLLRLLWPFGLSSLMLSGLLCGLSQAVEAEPEAAPVVVAQEGGCAGLPDYLTGVLLGEQVRNMVSNSSIEQVIGESQWKLRWVIERPVFLYPDTHAGSRLPGCSVDLQPLDTDAQGEPGELTEYEMILTNDSSCRGEAYVVAASSQDWPVVVNPPQQPYSLAKREDITVTVSVSVPEQAQADNVAHTLVTATLECESPCTDSGVDTVVVTTSVCCVPVEQVGIEGPTSGLVNILYTFTATVSPPSATPSISFIWWPPPDTGQGFDRVTYTWDTSGTKIITVTAANACGMATDTHSISIEERKVYLPLVSRYWPPIPSLYVVSGDITGSYNACWNTFRRAEFYVLEGGANEFFDPPAESYTLTDVATDPYCHRLDGRDAMLRYYRVKACNENLWPDDKWSNVVRLCWDDEPNDSRSIQNTELAFGEDYCGYPDDPEDWFTFYVSAPGWFTITLDSYTGTKGRLKLRSGHEGDTQAGQDDSPPYVVTRTVGKTELGWYHVCVETLAGFNQDTPYVLHPRFAASETGSRAGRGAESEPRSQSARP